VGNNPSTRLTMGRRARRLLRDMFVVVASILIAFALDAWWGWRNDRKEEHEKLVGLKAEFTAISNAIRRQAANHTTGYIAVDSLMLLTGPSADPAMAPRVEPLLQQAFVPSTLDVSSGTLNAILASGRLEVIRNAELRRGLAAWDGNLRDATEDEVDARVHVMTVLLPLLADDKYVRARARFSSPVPRPGPGFSITPVAMLTDPRFASALDFRAGWLRHVVDELNEVETEARRILGLIDSELQR
jgi:hypothetical protein